MTAKISVIVAAMLDLQSLRELGRGSGVGVGEGEETGESIFLLPSLPPPFPVRLIPSPLLALFTLPNLPLILKSKMAGYSVRSPKKYACIAGYML